MSHAHVHVTCACSDLCAKCALFLFRDRFLIFQELAHEWVCRALRGAPGSTASTLSALPAGKQALFFVSRRRPALAKVNGMCPSFPAAGVEPAPCIPHVLYDICISDLSANFLHLFQIFRLFHMFTLFRSEHVRFSSCFLSCPLSFLVPAVLTVARASKPGRCPGPRTCGGPIPLRGGLRLPPSLPFFSALAGSEEESEREGMAEKKKNRAPRRIA